MRHRLGQRKLNITDGAHRRAMMRHIGGSLIRHEKIKTTLARAKELRRFIEPLITLGKTPSVHNRRLAFSRLQDRESVSKLFDVLGPRVAQRPGGYVRVLKSGYRCGDNAPMALVEFVDKPTAEEVAAQAAALAATKAADKRKTKPAEKKREKVVDGDSETDNVLPEGEQKEDKE